MAKLTISDLLIDGDFCEQLTEEELELNILGGATGAGSISAGKFYQNGDFVQEEAVTATVATSDPQPFKIDLRYSSEPRLFVSAGVKRF